MLARSEAWEDKEEEEEDKKLFPWSQISLSVRSVVCCRFSSRPSAGTATTKSRAAAVTAAAVITLSLSLSSGVFGFCPDAPACLDEDDEAFAI
jgi:hypothetical protein